ncbi:C-C chemokine receptor type 1-like [Nothobranchius furzeri]|uniref:C-C chemokine receptor type 1-like n=1 Tax=Nothobranchius furzeri TaxID=105023 RepID=A0A8C6KVJ7_NOTFU|nr:C-C chemokine receptor type 1 [Nothobranchius furzeri]KAF7226099.1 C-C chemokine receptor type 1-like [Nothobranchius furzeri]
MTEINATDFLTTSDYSSYYYGNDSFSPCEKFETQAFSRGFLVTLYILVFILGSIGNGLVVVVLVKHRNQTNLTDMCLLNLALSDLLFIFTLPFYTHYILINQWNFGDFMCRFLSCSHHSGFYSSVFFMVVMTLDRYVVIMHAHKVARYRTLKAGVVMIVLVWMLSICVSLPSFIFAKVTSQCDELGCHYSHENKNWLHYDLFSTNILGLVIPLVVMVVCYSRIIPILVNMRTAKRHRAVKLIVSIMIVFFLSWAPYNISRFLKFLCSNDYVENSCNFENIKVTTIVTEAIAYIHCCLNPIIYAFVGQKFMRRVMQLLKKWIPDSYANSSYRSFRKSSIASKNSDVTANVIM